MLDVADLLAAWLHDPPDKAFDIRGHVQRARYYSGVAFGQEPDMLNLDAAHADQVAAATERLPAPHWKADERAVVDADQLLILHPLCGKQAGGELVDSARSVEKDRVAQIMEQLLDGTDDLAARFLLLWRSLPDRLAAHRSIYAHIPADTRIPDHTIWDHLDTTTALQPSVGSNHGAAFLSFSVGPVQSFISSARTVRDLWSGSMILSWLAFGALLPVIRQYGPTSLVYPALRGIPMFDIWLREEYGLHDAIPMPALKLRKTPCIPNRFVAVVPWGQDGRVATELAEQCRAAARRRWHQLAEAVHRKLDSSLATIDAHWDRLWQDQIDASFDVRTTVLPWRPCDDTALAKLLTGSTRFEDAFEDVQAVRNLENAMPESDWPGYSQRSAGQWQYRLELSARLAEADKAVRRLPPHTRTEPFEKTAPKCSITGAAEQMGPSDLNESQPFWDHVSANVRVGGVRVRAGERLGAVALVKRFAGPVLFVKELQLSDARELRIEDTATIAAAPWLAAARATGHDLLDPDVARKETENGQWSGQWLHLLANDTESDDESCPNEIWQQIRDARKQHGAPPAYYSVLAMDGDELGKWLRGELSPRVRDILHPQLRSYFEDLPAAHDGLNKRRPVTPALHATISRALANFALHFVPAIVRRHQGTLIYAGGDDVLALLPTVSALKCVSELRETYREMWAADDTGRQRLLMGPTATVSAGLAVVHHKEDLRFALDQARAAEHAAKEAGRDTLFVAACRRSGEHAVAQCPWTFVKTVDDWVGAFRHEASDRWAYHLRALLPTLGALPTKAMQAEIRRQVNRSETETRQALGEQSETSTTAGDLLADAFGQFHDCLASRDARTPVTPSRSLEQFITLCQTAAFLARGRSR